MKQDKTQTETEPKTEPQTETVKPKAKTEPQTETVKPKAKTEPQTETVKPKAKTEPQTETVKPKTVMLELFKDDDKYKNDVLVIVNGKRYLIQRGVPVEVPVAVAEVLANSREQDKSAAELMEKEASKFAAAMKVLGE